MDYRFSYEIMNATMRFPGTQPSGCALPSRTLGDRVRRSALTASRLRQVFAAILLALMPVTGSAQVGRIFVSAEAYASAARIVLVGKIVELRPIEYVEQLTEKEKYGKPHRLVFEVTETIRGEEVKRLELVLSLQNTQCLDYMRDHSLEVMLVGGPDMLDTFPKAELGIEELGKRTSGEWYQFRLLTPLEAPEAGAAASVASQINTYYDSCRMFTHELGIVVGKDAILDRVRTFSRQHTKILPTVTLIVPNDFGALCGAPNAYCGIMLPVCPETKATLVALKNDPGLIMRRINSRQEDFDRSRLPLNIEKALSEFPDESGDARKAEPTNQLEDDTPAEAPKPIRTEYRRLTIEELAMRFRYPDRYMDGDKGESAPRDGALGEILRRKHLQRGTKTGDVEFLLGKPKPEEGSSVHVLNDGRVKWNYSMMGGDLGIVFDPNGGVAEMLEHHDGDPESAHTENLLDPKKQ